MFLRVLFREAGAKNNPTNSRRPQPGHHEKTYSPWVFGIVMLLRWPMDMAAMSFGRARFPPDSQDGFMVHKKRKEEPENTAQASAKKAMVRPQTIRSTVIEDLKLDVEHSCYHDCCHPKR